MVVLAMAPGNTLIMNYICELKFIQFHFVIEYLTKKTNVKTQLRNISKFGFKEKNKRHLILWVY